MADESYTCDGVRRIAVPLMIFSDSESGYRMIGHAVINGDEITPMVNEPRFQKYVDVGNFSWFILHGDLKWVVCNPYPAVTADVPYLHKEIPINELGLEEDWQRYRQYLWDILHAYETHNNKPTQNPGEVNMNMPIEDQAAKAVGHEDENTGAKPVSSLNLNADRMHLPPLPSHDPLFANLLRAQSTFISAQRNYIENGQDNRSMLLAQAAFIVAQQDVLDHFIQKY